MSRNQRLSLLLAAVLCAGAEPAHGWGNTVSHQDLFDASLEAPTGAQALERFLIEELGIREGTKVRLSMQLGFDAGIDEEIGPPGGSGSRLTDNLNKGEDEPDPADLVGMGVDIEVKLQAAPPCLRDAGFETCLEQRRTLGSGPVKWLRLGTWAEDNPNPRSRHHFHDPVRLHQPPAGSHGLDNSKEFLLGLDTFLVEPVTAELRGGSWLDAVAGMLLFPLRTIPGVDIGNFDFEGRSAVDRALNTMRDGSATSEADPDNLFSLADAERYLYAALSKTFVDEREHYLALHFLAVGHGIHLLQDMTSVAHVRNDFINDHLYSPKVRRRPSLEDAGDQLDISQNVLETIRGKAFESQPARFLREVPPRAPAAASDYLAVVPPALRDDFTLRDLWDEVPFEIPDGGGLAEFTHRNFFSAGTVTNRTPPLGNGYDAPVVPSCDTLQVNGPGSGPTWLAELPTRKIDRFESDSAVTYDTFISSPLVPHLARCRAHSLPLGSLARPFRPWSATVHDESVQRDYLELLWPQAIHYTSKFMERYWSPRLEVVPLDPASATPADRERKFKLANLSLHPFHFPADGIEVIFDGIDGERHRAAVSCGSGSQTLELEAAPQPGTSGPASSFVCELPVELPVDERPANRADFWIIARGALGERGIVAPASDYDEGRADYVVAFDHVRGDEIVYGGETILGDTSQPAGPARDAARQLDVFAIAVDPARGLVGPPPARQNLTEALRTQATDDFGFPAPMPSGDLIALRTDLGLPAQYDDQRAQEGLFRDVALLEPSEAGPPLLTPVEVCVEGAPNCVPSRTWAVSGASGWLDWSRDGQFLFFHVNGADNDLYRHDLEAERAVRVSPFQGADPLLTEPPLGYEREFCRTLASGTFSARSESEVAVTAACHRNRVTEVRGPNDYDTEIVRQGWDVFSTALVSEPGTMPESVPVKRLRPDPLRVDDCEGSPVCGATEEDDFEMFPVWSPDGRKLAFLRLRGEPLLPGRIDPSVDTRARELYVADVYEGSPSGMRRILELPEGEGFITTPTWSPGGEWIAFGIHGGPHPGDLYVVRTDGEEPQAPRRVTDKAGVVDRPAWRATTPLLLP